MDSTSLNLIAVFTERFYQRRVRDANSQQCLLQEIPVCCRCCNVRSVCNGIFLLTH